MILEVLALLQLKQSTEYQLKGFTDRLPHFVGVAKHGLKSVNRVFASTGAVYLVCHYN